MHRITQITVKHKPDKIIVFVEIHLEKTTKTNKRIERSTINEKKKDNQRELRI